MPVDADGLTKNTHLTYSRGTASCAHTRPSQLSLPLLPPIEVQHMDWHSCASCSTVQWNENYRSIAGRFAKQLQQQAAFVRLLCPWAALRGHKLTPATPHLCCIRRPSKSSPMSRPLPRDLSSRMSATHMVVAQNTTNSCPNAALRKIPYPASLAPLLELCFVCERLTL